MREHGAMLKWYVVIATYIYIYKIMQVVEEKKESEMGASNQLS